MTMRFLAILACCTALGASQSDLGHVIVEWGSPGSITPPTWTPDHFGSGATAFSIEMVLIDDTNNPGRVIWDGNTVGAVAYPYKMAKYVVSEDQMWKARSLASAGWTVSSLGTNMPATTLDQIECLEFCNYLNQAAGYPPAYNIVDGKWAAWPAELWEGGTNALVRAGTLYKLPDVHCFYKAAQWDKAAQAWRRYGQGETNAPAGVDGYYLRGGTAAGTAVIDQRIDDRFPEFGSGTLLGFGASKGNKVNVMLTTSAGGVTGIAFDSYVSGHVFQENTTNEFNIVQPGGSGAKARIATFQTVTNVPGTCLVMSGGAGYTDGDATITLGGDTVTVELVTLGGSVKGVIPTGGRFASLDYTTVLDVVQAGGSNATCRVTRYSNVTHNGPRVPATFTITAAGTGYTNGVATFTSNATVYHLTFDPLSGVYIYKACQGAAEVDKAGGPSPFGCVGMFGNVSQFTDTRDNYDNSTGIGNVRYYGGWWGRGTGPNWQDLGSETWNPNTATTGAWANGFRVMRYLLPGETE